MFSSLELIESSVVFKSAMGTRDCKLVLAMTSSFWAISKSDEFKPLDKVATFSVSSLMASSATFTAASALSIADWGQGMRQPL